jgi:hypothetical protein
MRVLLSLSRKGAFCKDRIIIINLQSQFFRMSQTPSQANAMQAGSQPGAAQMQ